MQTAAEISADLADLRAARMRLAKGERIEEVWRDGRRVTYATMTLTEITALISQLEADLESALASEAGKPRRRAIGTFF